MACAAQGKPASLGPRGVGGRPTNAIDDAAVSKYHNNRSLINICTNRGRSARARRSRGAAAPGIPALAVGGRVALAFTTALLRHDVDEVDLHPRADAVVRGDDVPIISLPVGEAAAAGLCALGSVAATTRAYYLPSLRRISCGRGRKNGRGAARDTRARPIPGRRAAGSRASRAARRFRARLRP